MTGEGVQNWTKRGFGDIRPLVLGSYISNNKIDDKLLLNLGAKFQRLNFNFACEITMYIGDKFGPGNDI